MELQGNESDGSRLLRCDPHVYVPICANGFDRSPLSYAPIITIECAIDGGFHRRPERFKHGFPGTQGQPYDRVELGVLEGLNHHLKTALSERRGIRFAAQLAIEPTVYPVEDAGGGL